MPYKVEKRGDEYCVIKESDGKSMGCHASESEADDQLKALYASEEKAADAQTSKSLTDTIADFVDERLAAFGLRRKMIVDGVGFKVVKNHFVAVWSNDFIDRDDEIFPAKAQRDYVARVDMGITPLPDLWVWHVNEAVKVGKAHLVEKIGHFMIAAGEWDDTPKAQRAKAYYSKHARETSISHGFTYPQDKFDGKHYHAFNTFEISLLPRGVEANRFTTLERVKSMAMDDKKRQYLIEVFGEDTVKEIETSLDQRGKALEALGVEFKDFAPVTEVDAETDTKAAAPEVDKAVKELLIDALDGNGQAIETAVEIAKQVKAWRAEWATEKAALEQQIADLNARLDDTPRQGSKDAATELTPENMVNLLANVEQQEMVTDKFWGTQVPKTGN